MKGARLNILIAAIVLSIIALFFFTNFEYKLVKDEDWKEDYHPKSKKNYGLMVFEDLLKKKLGKENVITDYNLKLNSLQDSNLAIIIFYTGTNAMSYEGINDYDSLLVKGNDLYLFSSNLDFIHNDLYYHHDTSYNPASLDTFERQDGHKIGFNFSSLKGSNNNEQILNLLKVVSNDEDESSNDIDESNSDTYESDEDSVYAKVEQVDTTMSDTFEVNTTIDEAVQDSIRKVIESKVDTLLSYHGKPVFQRVNDLNGHVYTHTFPVLLTNVATKNSSAYADHFNILLNELKGKKVIITAGNLSSINDNPLKVLLRNKALSLAYFTMLFALLLYLIFGSKRLQRPIPIKEPIKNTSLEYIHTLSRLYELQGQNYKLVLKMKENFYHMVAKRFYISQEDENFVHHLSKKSKIKEELLNATIQYFNHIERNKVCSDEQLEMLNIYLSKIENQINHGNNQ
jgi:hypothetical protein